MASKFLPAITNRDSGFSTYLYEVNKIPSLTEEEEFSYAKSYYDHGDTNSAQMLVTSHLKLVAKVAMTYRGYGLPIVELVSEGNIGLMQAVKKFDPNKGFRLSTYAVWWIKASIQEYILRSWSLVKIGTTAAQKKLFFNLGKIKRRIQDTESRNFNSGDYKTVADELDVSISDVAEMNSRLNQDYSLDDPIGYDEGSSLMEILPVDQEDQEQLLEQKQESDHKKALLIQAIEQLNDREKRIINDRKLKENPVTLDELSKFYGVSKERIRQIEERAMEKLQNIMNPSE